MRLRIACDCGDEEHEVDVEAELGGYGIHAKNGIYSPCIDDVLPCGRLVTEADMDSLFNQLDEWGRREDE